jgi:hypothetical protein
LRALGARYAILARRQGLLRRCPVVKAYLQSLLRVCDSPRVFLTRRALERIVLTLNAVRIARSAPNRKSLRSLKEREGEPVV